MKYGTNDHLRDDVVAMSLFGTALFSRRNIPAWLVLFAGLVLTGLISALLAEQRARSANQQFDLHVSELVEAIEKRLRDHEQILLGGAGLFDVSGLVTRAQWRDYVERLSLQEHYPGIQGVGYSQVILPAALPAHIAAVRAEGFSEYAVRPEGKRALYTSIIYLEPFKGRNLAAFGYDMHSEPMRRQAMQLAVNSNMTTISGKVKLVQEIHGKEQAGFLMYVPYYDQAMPTASPEERWQALQGFVYSPYRMADLMHGILGGRDMVVDFTLHNGDSIETDSLMYDSSADHAYEYEMSPSHLSNRRIEAYGQAWTLSLRSRPAFQAQFSSSLDWMAPSLGAGISLSLFALVGLLLGGRERALTLADEMTARRIEFEHWFHQLFLHMRQGVVIHGPGGGIQEANPAAERILGRSLGQLQDNTFHPSYWSAIHEDGSDFPVDEYPISVSLREGRAVKDVVMGIWHPETSERRWIRIDAYPHTEDSGHPKRGTYSVFSDITEQRAADMAVRQTRRLLGDVLAAASELAIIATDCDGLVTIFNKGAERQLGYSAGEIVGKMTAAVFHDADEIEARAAELSIELGFPVGGFRVFIEGPERDGSETREWTHVHKTGRRIPVSVVVTPIYDETGEVTGYLGIAEDITERKRVERMKSEFVSTVSHELRTPLTSISGALGLIASGELGDLSEQGRQMIDIAHKNSLRLGLLVNDLLDMEKIAAGKLHFEMRIQPLMPLIKQALKSHKTYGAEHKVKLVLESELTDVEVRVDSQRLMQVLANLLSNAIKFSPEGGTVCTSVRRRPDTVQVAVADHGSGISEAFRASIFKKFSQADSSDTREKGGTGLGLAITRELVERMDGIIGFDSVQGEGATFWFELPLITREPTLSQPEEER